MSSSILQGSNNTDVPPESNIPLSSASNILNSIPKINPQELYGKLQPFVEKFIDLCTFLLPYFELLQSKWQQLWLIIGPYYNEYYSSNAHEILFGIVLLLFGGQFSMTIACYTALKISGWSLVKQSYAKLKSNYNLAMTAFDDSKGAKALVDTDNDGHISLQEKISFCKLFIKSTKDEKLVILNEFRGVFIAIDPQQLLLAISGFWTVFITLIATLRSKFAKDIALGISIGDIICTSTAPYIRPWLRKQFNDDMKKWSDCMLEMLFRFIGISLALMIVRMTSAFHSAVKGAQLLTLFLFRYLVNKKLLEIDMVYIESHKFFIFVQYGLALWGFWWQFRAGFAIGSVFFRLVLFPFSIVEVILSFLAMY